MTSRAPHKAKGRTRRTGDFLALLAGVGFGVALGTVAITETWSDFDTAAPTITTASRFLAVGGTYAVLLCVLLVARIPWLEREVGLDRLVLWHRKLAPWALFAIAGHVILVTVGYSMSDRSSILGELWTMITTTRWILPATAGFALMVMAGITSYRLARQRMRYETWWVVHLYTYLGIALAFAHQLTLGPPFMQSGWARTFWIGLYILTLGSVIAFRILLPVWRTARHQVKVHAVVQEAPGVVSIWMKGRKLDRLGATGGQFFAWRFLAPHQWWQAHPYSLSAPPQPGFMRITVKDLGDHSAWLASVHPGTRVLVEGPYGAFTATKRHSDRVVLIGAGVGITPIRALLEELPESAHVDVLYRASSEEELMMRDEFAALATRRGVRVRYLVGPRSKHPMDARSLQRLVPDIAVADVYVCGPDPMTEAIVESLATVGVPLSHIHSEAFAF